MRSTIVYTIQYTINLEKNWLNTHNLLTNESGFSTDDLKENVTQKKLILTIYI